jgi:hypothetical protein
MASISGQSTANINQVDGFFTTQGGGLIVEPVISGTGVQISANTSLPYRQDVTADYNRTPVENHVFTKIAVSQQYTQIIGIKADGSLWYFANTSIYATSFFTTLGAWTQYGSDTDWEYVTSGALNWGFIKGGDYYFMGYNFFGQAGDGTTISTNSPTLTVAPYTFSKVRFGQFHTALLTTTGEVYTCGQNSNYATGLGVSTGNTLNLTRESASLTGVTDIECAYQLTRIIVSGNIYSTGVNNYRHAGPLIASTANINGPILGYNGGDIVKIFSSRDFSIGLTSAGEVRHAGTGNGRRVDNNIAPLTGYTGQSQEQFTLLTGGGTGWTDFYLQNSTSTTFNSTLGIKNGEVYYSSQSNPNLDAWDLPNVSGVFHRVGTFNTATAIGHAYVSAAYPVTTLISVS